MYLSQFREKVKSPSAHTRVNILTAHCSTLTLMEPAAALWCTSRRTPCPAALKGGVTDENLEPSRCHPRAAGRHRDRGECRRKPDDQAGDAESDPRHRSEPQALPVV